MVRPVGVPWTLKTEGQTLRFRGPVSALRAELQIEGFMMGL